MLKNHPTIAPSIIDAELVPLKTEDDVKTRFFGVRDDLKIVQSAVSARYEIMQPSTLVNALDLALDGFDHEVRQAGYDAKTGRWDLVMDLPGLVWKEPGARGSDVVPNVRLRTSHGSNAATSIMVGEIVMACSNGLVVGVVDEWSQIRHTRKNANVYEIMVQAIRKMSDRIEAERLMAEALHETWYPLRNVPSRDEALEIDAKDRRLLQQLMANVGARSADKLETSIRQNREAMGDNLWALEQAVTEVGTHALRGQAAEDWTRAQSALIRSFADSQAVL